MRTVMLVTYTFLTLLSLALLVWIIPSQTPPGIGYGIAPAVLPNLLASVMLVTSGFLLLKTLRDKNSLQGPTPLSIPVWAHVLKYCAVLFLMFPVISIIGFLPGSILFLVVIQYFAGQRNLLVMLGLAVAVSLITYFLVTHGMGVELTLEPVIDFGGGW